MERMASKYMWVGRTTMDSICRSIDRAAVVCGEDTVWISNEMGTKRNSVPGRIHRLREQTGILGCEAKRSFFSLCRFRSESQSLPWMTSPGRSREVVDR
jgi:hypothetical protein